MGRVTELLEQMLERQVAERGIVLWYDPQKVYATFAHNLELPKATVLRFSEGFFRLRQQLEPYLEYVMDDGTLKPAIQGGRQQCRLFGGRSGGVFEQQRRHSVYRCYR